MRKAAELASYSDKDFGFFMAAPPEWFFYKHDKKDKPDKTFVELIAPDVAVKARMRVNKTSQEEETKTPRTVAEDRISDSVKAFKDYVVREDSWAERTTLDLPAVSYVADFKEGDQSMVEYRIVLASKAIEAGFILKIPTDQFERYRATFDTIAESFKLN